MKRCVILSVLFLCIVCPSLLGAATGGQPSDGQIPSIKESFNEVWAYLMQGEEVELKGSEPITDLCYFGAYISYKSALAGVKSIPQTAKLPENARIHLVIADLSHPGRVHYIADPSFPMRKKFIADVAAAASGFSGVQIDFESIKPDDTQNFLSFLADLKTAIGSKILSIALPARTKDVNDAFSYGPIARIVDRVFIMAYDQHWSGSEPGPIASPDWCNDVAQHVLQSVPAEKLVMGIPFYGRSWQDKKTAKAYRYSTLKEVLKKRNLDIHAATGEYPNFEYDEHVKVTVFFENINSIMKKAALYRSFDVKGIGFWRIGQNPGDVWNYLSISNAEEPSAK